MDSKQEARVLLERIEPQPPMGIKYCVGGQSWLSPEDRDPIRLVCEEWGHLGPVEIDPDIKPNKAGFRVRITEIPAPEGARWFTKIDGVYYWTTESVWDTREGNNGQ